MEPLKNSTGGAGDKLKLDLGLRECLLRGFFAILIPMILLLIDYHLIAYAIPVIVYLYITAIIHFCPIKHKFRRLEKKSDEDTNEFWDRG